MTVLRQGIGNSTSQRAERQIGTSDNPVTLDAGDDTQSVSGAVP